MDIYQFNSKNWYTFSKKRTLKIVTLERMYMRITLENDKLINKYILRLKKKTVFIFSNIQKVLVVSRSLFEKAS